MSFTPNANGPRGFDVAKGRDGTPQRSVDARVLGTYANKLYTGQAVELDANGQIVQRAAAANKVYGVFDGCEYVEVSGEIRFSPYWPAPGAVKAGSVVKARVYPATGLFLVKADGQVTQSDIGKFANLNVDVATGGNDFTGRSSSTLAIASISGTVGTLALRIVEVSPREEGGEGAPGSLCIVEFVRPQQTANVA